MVSFKGSAAIKKSCQLACSLLRISAFSETARAGSLEAAHLKAAQPIDFKFSMSDTKTNWQRDKKYCNNKYNVAVLKEQNVCLSSSPAGLKLS